MRRILRSVLFVLLCILLCTCSSDPSAPSVAPVTEEGPYVFHVGQKPFKTLRAAVSYVESILGTKAATGDCTITMDMDAEGDGAAISSIKHGVVIDFCNHSYTFTGSSSIAVDNSSLEMKNVNMEQGRVEAENNSYLSMTGNSVFTGTVSVAQSVFSVDSESNEVSIDLAVYNAELEFCSDVKLTSLDRDEEDNSTYTFAQGVTVLLDNTDLSQMLVSDALMKSKWRYTGVLDYTPVAVDLGYSFTYKAQFSFLDDENCRLVVYRYKDEQWSEFGTLNGTYVCTAFEAREGYVLWNEDQANLYTGVYFSLEPDEQTGKTVLILTDPGNDTMVFPQEADSE